MKKRDLAIAAGVLIPFAVLVALGFHYASPAPALPEDGRHAVNAEPPRVLPPLPPAGEGPGEGEALDAGLPDAGRALPPELRAAITAVLPEVLQCFRDQKLRRPTEVKVFFTPTRDGGFERVRVNEQNPYLAACLEDVFAEVSWTPEGPETFSPADHTFSFDPSKD